MRPTSRNFRVFVIAAAGVVALVGCGNVPRSASDGKAPTGTTSTTTAQSAERSPGPTGAGSTPTGAGTLPDEPFAVVPTTVPPATHATTTVLPTPVPSTPVPPATGPPVILAPVILAPVIVGSATTLAPPAVLTLRGGSQGSEVLALEQRLVELGYWTATVDDSYDRSTEQAVMAFQKAEALVRDGIAGPATLGALSTAVRVVGRSGASDGRVVEIDLARQLLLIVEDGVVVDAFNTSTGTGGRWPTPTGHYKVQREIDGIRYAKLGELYRPKYFNSGIAIHGSSSIPAQPASHGCVRVSNAGMDHLWSTGQLAIGTSGWVY